MTTTQTAGRADFRNGFGPISSDTLARFWWQGTITAILCRKNSRLIIRSANGLECWESSRAWWQERVRSQARELQRDHPVTSLQSPIEELAIAAGSPGTLDIRIPLAYPASDRELVSWLARFYGHVELHGGKWGVIAPMTGELQWQG